MQDKGATRLRPGFDAEHSLVNEAERLFEEGQYTQACHVLLQALATDNRSVRTWNDLGVCLAALGERPGALEALENALTIDPADPLALENRAALLDEKVAPKPDIDPSPRYFSQHGEDAIIAPIFEGLRNGFFVEVGCIDGLRFSNTYYFEKQGWTGVCVEPHPDYFPLMVANRPRSRCFQIAVSDQSAEHAVFHSNSAGSLSALRPLADDATLRQRFGEAFSGYEQISVPTDTLDHLLQEAGAPIGFEILSIDVEGTETDVLRGFTLEKYWPRIVIIEENHPGQSFDEYFLPRGYINTRTLECNIFYCRDARDSARIRAASPPATEPTQHPLWADSASPS